MTNVLLIATGGFLGAICRYLISIYAKKQISTKFPVGTLIVNLAGSFLLGLLLSVDGNEVIKYFFGIGFMGAFTTFSTFKLETVQLIESSEKKLAFVNVLLTYTGGITLAFLGFLIGKL